MPRKSTISKKTTPKNKLLKAKPSLKNIGKMMKKTAVVITGVASIVALILFMKKLMRDKKINDQEKIDLKSAISKLEELNKKLNAKLNISEKEIRELNKELTKLRRSLSKMKDIEDDVKRVQKLFKDMAKKN